MEGRGGKEKKGQGRKREREGRKKGIGLAQRTKKNSWLLRIQRYIEEKENRRGARVGGWWSYRRRRKRIKQTAKAEKWSGARIGFPEKTETMHASLPHPPFFSPSPTLSLSKLIFEGRDLSCDDFSLIGLFEALYK